MSPERITHLTAPPVVGRWYLVPTVSYAWLYHDAPRAWPVFLPKHEDAEHLNFPYPHYHVDPRFLTAAEWRKAKTAGAAWDRPPDALAAWGFVQRSPLSSRGPGPDGNVPHPPVEWRRKRCARAAGPYVHGDKPAIQGLRAHFGSQVCASSAAGWICPHKRFPLGSIAPDADGVLTCPLHGLRVRAADGVVLSD